MCLENTPWCVLGTHLFLQCTAVYISQAILLFFWPLYIIKRNEVTTVVAKQSDEIKID